MKKQVYMEFYRLFHTRWLFVLCGAAVVVLTLSSLLIEKPSGDDQRQLFAAILDSRRFFPFFTSFLAVYIFSYDFQERGLNLGVYIGKKRWEIFFSKCLGYQAFVLIISIASCLIPTVILFWDEQFTFHIYVFWFIAIRLLTDLCVLSLPMLFCNLFRSIYTALFANSAFGFFVMLRGASDPGLWNPIAIAIFVQKLVPYLFLLLCSIGIAFFAFLRTELN